MNGRTLRQIRKRLGKTQEEFAPQLGIAQPTLSTWETGKVAVPQPFAIRVRLLEMRQRRVAR